MAGLCLALTAAAGAAAAERPNVLFIAVDDLRPQFGRAYSDAEVLTPQLDEFFLDGGGTIMTQAYVTIAVCGPSRTSMLTSRRPDNNGVNVVRYDPAGLPANASNFAFWCWCGARGNNCDKDKLFMTLPTYLRQHGYTTAGSGKLFHPEACRGYGDTSFSHAKGDDPRAWDYPYGIEANESQVQWGSIPGPGLPGGDLSFVESPLSDDQETDGYLTDDAIGYLRNLSARGVGHRGAGKPFFVSVGLHKPHLPQTAPKKYFDLYPIEGVSLAPNPLVPEGFLEENWHSDGTGELRGYHANAGVAFTRDNFSFTQPLGADFSRQQRRAYFAAISYTDANVGRVLGVLDELKYTDNTIVVLWGDHGWHLGDTNSWGKMTMFESATHNTVMWRVPGQVAASKGQNARVAESIDIFPTLVGLTGLPALPKCTAIDAPPQERCIDGESYASLFTGEDDAGAGQKQHAFSQWPQNPWGPQKHLRMGYTVRRGDGYRLTGYVPYTPGAYTGNWSLGAADIELYDYNSDSWETRNWASDPKYAQVVTELKAALQTQFDR